MASFTPAFQAVIEELHKLTSEGEYTEESLRDLFRKKMQEIGWLERLKNLYKIKDKNSGVFRPLVLNKSQIRFLTEKSNKSIILKSRQVGFTTISCIYALDRALFDNWNTGIMAHKKETVVKIFEIVKNAYDFFKKQWPEYLPNEDSNNTTKLSWADTKSSLTVAFDFQGLTVMFLHVSEAAFIPGARLVNSLQAVPDKGEIVLESTPNGRGGFFYEVWQDWRSNGNGCPYKGFFIPWFEHYPEDPEYYTPKTKVTWTDDELKLQKEYNLEDYHLFWRRDTIRGKCSNDVEQFDIQYPANDSDCFFASSAPVFPRSTLKKQERFVAIPSHVGILAQEDKKIKLYEDRQGGWKFWKLPTASKVYSMGADSSSGNGKDPSVIQVIDAASGEQVAEYVGFLEPDMFAQEIYRGAQFYYQAWVCVEENNHGATVLMALRDILRYPNLYRRQDFNSINKKISKQLGFFTSVATKLTITDQLANALRDGRVIVHSDALLSELSTFENVVRKLPDGRISRTNKREAQPGCYDDRVMALAFAYEMLRSRPASVDDSEDTVKNIGFLDADTGFYTSDNDVRF